MLVLVTDRSTYLVDVDLQLLLQVPGGTDCGIPQGVWHRAVLTGVPRPGEPLFCSVATADGTAVGLRTGPVRWVGTPPTTATLVDASIAAYDLRRQGAAPA